MTEKVRIELHSKSSFRSGKDRRRLYKMNNRFGDDVDVSVDQPGDEVLENITIAAASTVGTVVVNNPLLLADVINYIFASRNLELGYTATLDGKPLIEVSVDRGIDLSLIKIENEYQVNDSTVFVQPTTEQEAEKLRELVEDSEKE